MTANFSDRSSYIPFDRNAKSGEYIRSSHNDFATSSELKERKFSGFRHNSITHDMELWIEGEIVKKATAAELAVNPNLPNLMFIEHFKLADGG